MFKTAAWFYGKKLISDNLKIEAASPHLIILLELRCTAFFSYLIMFSDSATHQTVSFKSHWLHHKISPLLSSTQDLFSALIKGPTRTPYEDGLFLFDIQLPNIYPAVPPLFRYLSQCSGRLNPNLYDNGKVCVSLLGTWIGKVRAVLQVHVCTSMLSSWLKFRDKITTSSFTELRVDL